MRKPFKRTGTVKSAWPSLKSCDCSGAPISPRQGTRHQAPLLIELAKLRYRLLNDATPNTNATNKTPITVGLSVLLANRMAQIHAPSEQIVRSRKYPRSSLQ